MLSGSIRGVGGGGGGAGVGSRALFAKADSESQSLFQSKQPSTSLRTGTIL